MKFTNESLRYAMDVLNYRNTGIIKWVETVVEIHRADGKLYIKLKNANAIAQ